MDVGTFKSVIETDDLSDSCESAGDPNSDPKYPILNDVRELVNHLEMLHDRRIVKNLQSAGLSNFGFDDDDDEDAYCSLDPKARMVSGEPLLLASVLHIKDGDQQLRYVAILLCEKVDPNETDGTGKTALMYACQFGYAKTVKILLNHDAVNLYQKDVDGNTALMFAAAAGNLYVLKLYLKALRKIEKQTKSAKDINAARMALALLEMENSLGFNASMLALENNHYQCVALIEDARLKYLKELGKKSNAQSISSAHSSSGKLSEGTSASQLQHSGSCESLYQSKNVRHWRDVVQSNKVLAKSLAKTRNKCQFQSQQDLRTRRVDDEHHSEVIGSTENDPQIQLPSTRISSPGRLMHVTNGPTNLKRNKNELSITSDSAMIKSHTEYALSTSPDIAIISNQPTVPAHQKKTFAQGLISIFKRRQKFRNDRLLNHSVSELQPSNYYHNHHEKGIQKKSTASEVVGEPKSMRRKSVDLALRSFHHFIEKPTLGKFTSGIPEKIPLTPSVEEVDKSLALVVDDGPIPKSRTHVAIFQNPEDNVPKTFRPDSLSPLPPIRSSRTLTAEQFRETDAILDQLLSVPDATGNSQKKVSGVVPNTKRRSESAEDLKKVENNFV